MLHKEHKKPELVHKQTPVLSFAVESSTTSTPPSPHPPPPLLLCPLIYECDRGVDVFHTMPQEPSKLVCTPPAPMCVLAVHRVCAELPGELVAEDKRVLCHIISMVLSTNKTAGNTKKGGVYLGLDGPVLCCVLLHGELKGGIFVPVLWQPMHNKLRVAQDARLLPHTLNIHPHPHPRLHNTLSGCFLCFSRYFQCFPTTSPLIIQVIPHVRPTLQLNHISSYLSIFH